MLVVLPRINGHDVRETDRTPGTAPTRSSNKRARPGTSFSSYPAKRGWKGLKGAIPARSARSIQAQARGHEVSAAQFETWPPR